MKGKDREPPGVSSHILCHRSNLRFQLYQEHKEHLFSNKNIPLSARENWRILVYSRHASEDSHPPKVLRGDREGLRVMLRLEAKAWGARGKPPLS